MATIHDQVTSQGYEKASPLARRLGVSVQTLYRWVDTGKVRGTKVGGTRYVHIASLREYLGPEAGAALEVL